MKRALLLALVCFLPLHLAAQTGTTQPKKKPVSAEAQRKNQLRDRLCRDKDVKRSPGCEKVKSIFSDPRFVLYNSTPGTAPSPPSKNPKGNPFLTTSFGLLTRPSFERCRETYATYRRIFEETEKRFGVPKEFICARLRIETNFGRSKGDPIVSSLSTLYVRSAKKRESAFARLKDFLIIAEMLGWDALEIRGSYAGAFGLSQHMPSSYLNPQLVADGNGDGRIDLFTYEDAIPSIAAHDKACGWSDDPQDQFNAIYCYNHWTDYVDAVRAYAWVMKIYLEDNPIEETQEPAL